MIITIAMSTTNFSFPNLRAWTTAMSTTNTTYDHNNCHEHHELLIFQIYDHEQVPWVPRTRLTIITTAMSTTNSSFSKFTIMNNCHEHHELYNATVCNWLNELPASIRTLSILILLLLLVLLLLVLLLLLLQLYNFIMSTTTTTTTTATTTTVQDGIHGQLHHCLILLSVVWKNDVITADVKFRSVVKTPSKMDNFMHNCMQWPSTNTKIPMRNTAGNTMTRFRLQKALNSVCPLQQTCGVTTHQTRGVTQHLAASMTRKDGYSINTTLPTSCFVLTWVVGLGFGGQNSSCAAWTESGFAEARSLANTSVRSVRGMNGVMLCWSTPGSNSKSTLPVLFMFVKENTYIHHYENASRKNILSCWKRTYMYIYIYVYICIYDYYILRIWPDHASRCLPMVFTCRASGPAYGV